MSMVFAILGETLNSFPQYCALLAISFVTSAPKNMVSRCVAREMGRWDSSSTSGSGVLISLENKFPKTGTGEWFSWL